MFCKLALPDDFLASFANCSFEKFLNCFSGQLFCKTWQHTLQLDVLNELSVFVFPDKLSTNDHFFVFAKFCSRLGWSGGRGGRDLHKHHHTIPTGCPKKTHFQSMIQPSSTKQSKHESSKQSHVGSCLDCLVEEGCIMLWKCVFFGTPCITINGASLCTFYESCQGSSKVSFATIAARLSQNQETRS